jgi:hypothetical protein
MDKIKNKKKKNVHRYTSKLHSPIIQTLLVGF